jgi:nitrate/TMAO reductase-like tetraheme cytochrome c subunit
MVRAVRRLGWPGRIFVALGGLGVMTITAVEVTGQPGFCNSCHVMNPYYDSWTKSSHAQVNCLNCHLQPGLTGYVKGKINGLAQLVDCVVGRVGTKPSATIVDASCLRSECHATAELPAKTFGCANVHFAHDKHINKVVDGIKITCGTCHSHFEGAEHFSVNRDTCFTCHFLGGGASDNRLVKTNCQSCHEVPNQVIRRGYVKIDHQEFVSYKANCEESCHKRELRQASHVEETVCLDCHAFPKEADANSVELHKAHTNGTKVECFACHRKVAHGQTQVESVSAMMNCQSCHSDTHQVQRTIYGTQHPLQPKGEDRVLSPMFMTHVECTGCHMERTAKTPGTLDSFGTVARAVPAACDKCHEVGTGAKYVPFWQQKIKALYEEADKKVKEAEVLAAAQQGTGPNRELGRRVEQARSILDSVRYDGSWGVHNFKYTEALLLEADKMISTNGG